MSGGREWITAYGVVLVVLSASALGIGAAIRLQGYHLQKHAIYAAGDRQVSTLPIETENWIRIGSDQVEAAEIVEVLGTLNYVTRRYGEKVPIDPDHPVFIDLHVAYYTGMIDTVPHVPERCFVGGGLQQASVSRTLDIPLDMSRWVVDEMVESEFAGRQGVIYTAPTSRRFSDGRGRRVRMPRDVGPDRPLRLRGSSFTSESRTLYAGYLFIANGGTVASAEGVRTLAFDLTSDYAYYLKVQFTSTSVSSIEELAQRSGDLLDDLLAELMRCVPDWIEVQRGAYPSDNPRRAETSP